MPHTQLAPRGNPRRRGFVFLSKLSKALLRPTAVAIGNRRHHHVHIENFGLRISSSKSTISFKKSPRASLLPRRSSPRANGHSDKNLLSGTAITICRCVDGAFRHILQGYFVQFVDPFRKRHDSPPSKWPSLPHSRPDQNFHPETSLSHPSP